MTIEEITAEIDRLRSRAERAEAALAAIHGEEEQAPWTGYVSAADADLACPYRDLIEQLDAIVLLVDAEGIVRYANGVATEFFKAEPDGLPGTPLQDLLEVCDRQTSWRADGSELEAYTPAPSDFFCDECSMTRDGQVVWISWSHREIRDEDGALSGIVAVGTDITSEKQTAERLIGHQASLRSLASEVALAEERERKRIAGRIHDEISQNLAYAKLRISAITGCSEAAPCQETIAEIRRLLDSAIAGSRSLAFELSPPMLYELGFEDAVEWLVEQTDAYDEIECEFEDDGNEKPLLHDVSVTLFRAIRELLANVVRHSKAAHAAVCLSQDDGHLQVRVEDDGVGFQAEEVMENGEVDGGFGLLNIREGIEYVGGRMEVASNGGGGTTITLSVPLCQE